MRIVFTGAQGTGKTTLIDALKKNPKLKNFTFVDSPTRKAHKQGFKN